VIVAVFCISSLLKLNSFERDEIHFVPEVPFEAYFKKMRRNNPFTAS